MNNSFYITDISQQTITLEGVVYCRETVDRIPTGELKAFLVDWFNDKEYIDVQTSGSTGVAKVIQVSKQQMMNSACMTCDFLGLNQGDNALLCMSLKYIGAKMMVVRALVARLNLLVREASGHPLQTINGPLDFAAMVPLQVYNSLQVPDERKRLAEIKYLIIGGGAINRQLEKEIQQLPHAVYSTYGMTETLSHIAMRRLNGADASAFYTPFPSVSLSLSEEGTLIIEAPLVASTPVYTNDLAEILPDGKFIILGRKDNTINTGGIKVQIEKLEELYSPFIPYPFAVTSVADEKFGAIIVLLVECENEKIMSFSIPSALPSYYQPKRIMAVNKIPLTENSKKDRAACKELAHIENLRLKE